MAPGARLLSALIKVGGCVPSVSHGPTSAPPQGKEEAVAVRSRRRNDIQPVRYWGTPSDRAAADLRQVYGPPIPPKAATRLIRADLYSKKPKACTTLSLDHKAPHKALVSPKGGPNGQAERMHPERAPNASHKMCGIPMSRRRRLARKAAG